MNKITPPMYGERDEAFMRRALAEAEKALDHDDVPIGAVVVHEDEVIGTGHNERELLQDPTAHAEVLALREAAAAVGSWRGLRPPLPPALAARRTRCGGIGPSPQPPAVFRAAAPRAGPAGRT